MAEKTKDTLFIDMKYVILYRKRVYEYGATYTGKASVCDIFIKYKDGEEEDVRMAIVKQVIEREEKEIKILSLTEAVSLL